jgi:hypothetical protein
MLAESTGRLQVWNVIGRALVVRGAAEAEGGVAAVVARSAVVGGNRKTLCSCDGTVIWGVQPPELCVRVQPPELSTQQQQ